MSNQDPALQACISRLPPEAQPRGLEICKDILSSDPTLSPFHPLHPKDKDCCRDGALKVKTKNVIHGIKGMFNSWKDDKIWAENSDGKGEK